MVEKGRSTVPAAGLLLLTWPLFGLGCLILFAVSLDPRFTGAGVYDRFVYVPILLAAACSGIAARSGWRSFASLGRMTQVLLTLSALLPLLLTLALFVVTLAA